VKRLADREMPMSKLVWNHRLMVADVTFVQNNQSDGSRDFKLVKQIPG
jgi:hypothetical protein